VPPSLALILLAPLFAGPAAVAAPSGPEPAVVLVALPEHPDPAILEALNRLRGEAMSVGFEVRLLEPGSATRSQKQPGAGLAGPPPAAVVTVVRPDPGAEGSGALDVTFLDGSTGATSVAHVTAGEVGDARERADVIAAVRAVDFIRARMFDALAVRRVAPPSPPPPVVERDPRRYSLAAGVALVGTPSGFAPAVLPRLALGYAVAGWLRIGISAQGLGSRPGRQTEAGRVDLEQRYVGVDVALSSPPWHRLRLLAELGGGEYWVTVRGDPTAPYLGRSVTLASAGATACAGIAVALGPRLSLAVRGGTLWLVSEARISATDETYLGSLGRPLWFGDASLAIAF
jgi:hypothetical protein